jgi:hypothetical protein
MFARMRTPEAVSLSRFIIALPVLRLRSRAMMCKSAFQRPKVLEQPLRLFEPIKLPPTSKRVVA